jgi:hypothetical protein
MSKKLGQLPGPIQATEVIGVQMPHFLETGSNGWMVAAINRNTGVMVYANVYDGNLGDRFRIVDSMTKAIPANVGDFDPKGKGYKLMTPAQVESQLGGGIKIIPANAPAKALPSGFGKAEVRAVKPRAKTSTEVTGVQFGE